jgi:hypothetical protein
MLYTILTSHIPTYPHTHPHTHILPYPQEHRLHPSGLRRHHGDIRRARLRRKLENRVARLPHSQQQVPLRRHYSPPLSPLSPLFPPPLRRIAIPRFPYGYGKYGNRFRPSTVVFAEVGLDVLRPPGGVFMGLIKQRSDRIRPTLMEQLGSM